MADDDEPEVSRRQFFRGLTGDLLKIVGEVTGLAGEPEPPPVVNLKDGDVFISPEKQEATLNELFGFLEQLGAREEERPQAEAEAPAEAEGAEQQPELPPATAPEAQPG